MDVQRLTCYPATYVQTSRTPNIHGSLERLGSRGVIRRIQYHSLIICLWAVFRVINLINCAADAFHSCIWVSSGLDTNKPRSTYVESTASTDYTLWRCIRMMIGRPRFCDQDPELDCETESYNMLPKAGHF